VNGACQLRAADLQLQDFLHAFDRSRSGILVSEERGFKLSF